VVHTSCDTSTGTTRITVANVSSGTQIGQTITRAGDPAGAAQLAGDGATVTDVV
jgi:hypothetical protein